MLIQLILRNKSIFRLHIGWVSITPTYVHCAPPYLTMSGGPPVPPVVDLPDLPSNDVEEKEHRRLVAQRRLGRARARARRRRDKRRYGDLLRGYRGLSAPSGRTIYLRGPKRRRTQTFGVADYFYAGSRRPWRKSKRYRNFRRRRRVFYP